MFTKVWRAIMAAVLFVIGGVSLGSYGPPVVQAAGSIGGTVYIDQNWNAGFDSDEPGVESVEVVAYGPDGSVVGRTMTGTGGRYSLLVTTDTDVRVEFATPDGYFEPPQANVDGRENTKIQFLSAADVSANPEANYGVVSRSSERAASQVVVPFAPRGYGEDIGDLLKFDVNGNTLGKATPIIEDQQAGSLFGTASIDGRYVLSAAQLKRHSPLGPSGLGGIYLTDLETAPNVAPWVTIPNVGASPRTGGPNEPENMWDHYAEYQWDRDDDAFTEIHKVGLGDMDMGVGGRNVYVVNLFDKHLYKVPVNETTQTNPTPTAGTPEAISIDVLDLRGASATCGQDYLRPFGMESDGKGKLYVSLTCVGPNPSDLHGFVYTYDELTGAWSPAPVLEIDLETARESDPAGINDTPPKYDDDLAAYFNSQSKGKSTLANWHPWVDENPTPYSIGGDPYLVYVGYPQPTISDLSLDRNGNLAVSITDRTADQYADHAFLYKDAAQGHVRPNSAGDIMLACTTGNGSFQLEKNGKCGTMTSAFGVGKGDGPSDGTARGEFYYDREPAGHDEGHTGASERLPNTDIMLGTNYFGDVEGISQSDGAAAGGPYSTSQAHYKGDGLGELLAVTDTKVQIGDRVWYDIDRDGIQDADERPVVGVQVSLHVKQSDGSFVHVGSVNTDSVGEYRFDVKPGTEFEIRMDRASDFAANGPLYEWEQTYQFFEDSESPFDTHIDSNASRIGAVPTVVGSVGTESDQSFDIGFQQKGLKFEKRLAAPGRAVPNGDGTFTVNYELVVTNENASGLNYSLTDSFTFGSTVKVVSAKANGPGVSNKILKPTGENVIVDNATVPGKQTHIFTIAAVVSVDETKSSATILDCEKQGSESGTGTFNTATMSWDGADIIDDACAPLPSVLIAKDLVGNPVANGDGSYRVTYKVVATNNGSIDTVYDLDDKFAFSNGIEIVAGTAKVDSPDTDRESKTWNGVDNIDVVDAQPIQVGRAHTYTVVVNVKLNLPAPASAKLTCSSDRGQSGEGLFNSAVITHNGEKQEGHDCGELPHSILFTKNLLDLKPNGDGTYTVRYELLVSNGSGSDKYNLTDRFNYGEGVVVVGSPTVKSTTGQATNPAWNGDSGPYEVVTGQAIASGANHRYVVTAKVRVDPTRATKTTLDCAGGETRAGSGLWNNARLDASNTTINDDACEQLPMVTFDKVLSSEPTQRADGTFDVGYTITVRNIGPINTSYGLTDRLQFGEGVTVVSSAATTQGGPNVSAWTGAGRAVALASNHPIASGATHTYKIAVNTRLATNLKTTAQDCAFGSGESGTGFWNHAELQHMGATLKDDACAPIHDLALRKTRIGSELVATGDLVTFSIEVFNQGGVPEKNIVVTDYIPVGLRFVASESPGWSISGSNIVTTIPGPLNPGASTTVEVTFAVEATTGVMVNIAEISDFEDPDGKKPTDRDSKPDTDPGNDKMIDDIIDNTGDDQDDHDPAQVALTGQEPPTPPTGSTAPPGGPVPPLPPAPPAPDPGTLPSTGASGTQQMLTVAGLILLIGGALFITTRRRRRAN